jgi:hypothetical protein
MGGQHGGPAPPPAPPQQQQQQQGHPPQTPSPHAKLNHLGQLQPGDSPGFLDDFSHLGLINDLLDDSMF